MDTSPYRTPGQLITALLAAREWTKRVLAIVLAVDEAVITRLINGQRAIDAEMALKLGEVFGLAPEEFLDRQREYDLAVARFKTPPDPGRATRAALFGDLPVADMIKRGWIDAAMKDPPSVESELTRFFGVAAVSEIPILPHAAKKTTVFSPATPAQHAWIYRVRQIAQGMLTARYSPEAVRAAVGKLSVLRQNVDDARKVPRILSDAGIRFVIVETLKSAKIDGVCFWLNDFQPVIGMTMRHDRIDNFWFVLRHELEHVIQRHGREVVMLDADLEGDGAHSVASEEVIANQAAADFCVPTAELQKFISRKSPSFPERDIVGFARANKLHPGLVAGQLRRATGRYDRFHAHLVKVRSTVMPYATVDGWGDVAPID